MARIGTARAPVDLRDGEDMVEVAVVSGTAVTVRPATAPRTRPGSPPGRRAVVGCGDGPAIGVRRPDNDPGAGRRGPTAQRGRSSCTPGSLWPTTGVAHPPGFPPPHGDAGLTVGRPPPEPQLDCRRC